MHTIFLSPDRDDCSVGPTLHCEGLDGAVVDVEGMERTHNELSHGGISCQLEQGVSLSFGDVDPVLTEDAVQIFLGGRAPVEEDVGGVDCIA